MIAIQFMKYFQLPAEEAINASETCYMITLNRGEMINEPRWFKALIFEGEVKLLNSNKLKASSTGPKELSIESIPNPVVSEPSMFFGDTPSLEKNVKKDVSAVNEYLETNDVPVFINYCEKVSKFL